MGVGSIYIQPTVGHGSSSPPPPPPVRPPPATPEANQNVEEVYNYGNFSDRYIQNRAPLGIVLADKIVNGTWGSLSVDLKRPQLPQMGTRTSLFTFRQAPPQYQQQQQQQSNSFWGGGWGLGQRRRPGRPSRYEQEARRQQFDYDALPNFAFSNNGARVKAMRHVSFGPKMDFVKYGRKFNAPALDLGVGFDFEFDTAQFRPLVRLKMHEAASLKLLPYPALKFQKRLQIGTSGFAVRLSYECPLEQLHRFYAPPARLIVTVDNAVDTGVRLTQSGLEFSANKWLLNGAMRIRGSGILHLPSELPICEDDMAFGFEARRLGIKTRW